MWSTLTKEEAEIIERQYVEIGSARRAALNCLTLHLTALGFFSQDEKAVADFFEITDQYLKTSKDIERLIYEARARLKYAALSLDWGRESKQNHERKEHE